MVLLFNHRVIRLDLGGNFPVLGFVGNVVFNTDMNKKCSYMPDLSDFGVLFHRVCAEYEAVNTYNSVTMQSPDDYYALFFASKISFSCLEEEGPRSVT